MASVSLSISYCIWRRRVEPKTSSRKRKLSAFDTSESIDPWTSPKKRQRVPLDDPNSHSVLTSAEDKEALA
jgi:hypothetical protein